jgi:poly-gamma-glutamate synthesis protein (capsule biosynthesis protein)
VIAAAAAALAAAVMGSNVPAPPPVRVEIAASGDLLLHSPVYHRAWANGGGRRYDFRPMLRSIAPRLRRADIALCHMETPLVPGSPSGYPRFRSPPAIAGAVRSAGWDACSTASNHSVDAGMHGIRTTLRALRRAGLRSAGTYARPRGRTRPLIFDVRGAKVAFLAYTEHTNGIPLPHPWAVNLASRARIVRDARRARRRGADAVIVNLHWGDEYQHQPSQFQRRLARGVLRSGQVTAIVGQHVHVVQPIRLRRGRAIVFGEGNLLSNQTAACCPAETQDGLIALLTLSVSDRRARVVRVRYVPTWVRHPDFRVVPVHRGDPSWRRTVGWAGKSRGVRPLP